MIIRSVLLSLLLYLSATGNSELTNRTQKGQSTPDSKEAIPALNMSSIEECFYFVRGTDGSGSAFLLEDKDGVWLISNSHVFQHVKSPRITNIRRDEIPLPARIEVAADRDLIRFRVDRPHGLSLADSCNFDQSICAFGDSGGAGVLSVLGGKVVAVGYDRIEISAKIISGNSGGPVVDANSQVVGVSSYLLNHKNMPAWITKDTPFTETRRMALRLQDVKWVPVDFKTYKEEAGIINGLEDSMSAFIDIADSLSKDISKPITSSIDNEEVQKWLQKHNRLADNISEAKKKIYFSQSGVNAQNDALYRNAKRNLAGLAEMLGVLEEDAGNIRQVTTPYFATVMTSYSSMFRTIREHMEAAYSGLN